MALSLLLIGGLLLLVIVNGLGYFWPHRLVAFELRDGSRRLGEIRQREPIPGGAGERIQIKRANRDIYGADFEWIPAADIVRRNSPKDAILIERYEWGNFFGYMTTYREGDVRTTVDGTNLRQVISDVLDAARRYHERRQAIERRISRVNGRIDRLRWKIKKIEYRHGSAPLPQGRIQAIQTKLDARQTEYEAQARALNALDADARTKVIELTTADGQTAELDVAGIVRIYRPNGLGFWGRLRVFTSKVAEFVLAEPREANTEGGIFPAIFGTVTLVILMSIAVVPFGVVAAFYLREYARQGPLIQLVRIAVNNLAGVPSIVFGVFGVGFFIYTVGGGIDRMFFPERLPNPTYGTGGILWASLTLALLTVPVVIVSTEEALAAVPRSWKEASYALGATQFQTICRVLLPASMPGILTGLILAMARAAGEVAPLMITGAVKLAPALPIDGQFPFFHLNRQFMHLGFHIYDVGFQSPNVEAAKPMVYATALLLLVIVVVLNLSAMLLRNHLRMRFKTEQF